MLGKQFPFVIETWWEVWFLTVINREMFISWFAHVHNYLFSLLCISYSATDQKKKSWINLLCITSFLIFLFPSFAFFFFFFLLPSSPYSVYLFFFFFFLILVFYSGFCVFFVAVVVFVCGCQIELSGEFFYCRPGKDMPPATGKHEGFPWVTNSYSSP